MCGIVGILGKGDVVHDVVEALRRLEYRGYDSSGVATVSGSGLARRRAQGKLRNLEARLEEHPLAGQAGIGHTRWATHGEPTESNAHPHMNERLSVVHNGIIENFRELRDELVAKGARFESDTDTETVVHLISQYLDEGVDHVEAVQKSLKRLNGAFALGIIFADDPDLMIAARKGSPLAIGYGDGEVYLGSDAIALAPFTMELTYLEEGDYALLRRNSVVIFNENGNEVERPRVQAVASALTADKGNYRHFMHKEIHEQPEVVSHTLAHYFDMATRETWTPELGIDLTAIDRVTISACGTAYYAGLVAKYWIERYAHLPVEIDAASEMRYREAPMPANGLAVFVSQSGETADTLATLRYAKANGQRIVSIVNVPTSTIARESDQIMPTLAGPEIGVASTKAFTCQLAALAALTVALGKATGRIDRALEEELLGALMDVPYHITSILHSEPTYIPLATELAKARDILYLGRNISFPIAMEGALKLKEISYIHAEGYPAGELKHGPIALINDSVPVIVIAPKDALFEKTISNMQEVAARGARIILISDVEPEEVDRAPLHQIRLPRVHPFVSPLISAIPIQLIAYHTAVLMGTDVDQPRNLAKSVTVE